MRSLHYEKSFKLFIVLWTTGKVNEYGNYIDIQVWDGTTIRYAHQQQSSFVQVGDEVSAGQQIGLVGSTGYCAPRGYTHLHFQIFGFPAGKSVDDYYLF